MALFGLGHTNTAPDLFETRRGGARREYDGTDPHYQSAVATVALGSKGLRELKLYPIEFGLGAPRSQSGRPMLAEGDGARETLERFRRLSEPFKTKVDVQGDVGVLQLA
jgi:poly-gamma-glutamate synthesis protein (capsule biosynthesis protein)